MTAPHGALGPAAGRATARPVTPRTVPGWVVLALLLGALACWQPVLLYLVALAGFGLPHICWEMAWVRQVWGAAIGRVAWLCLLAPLVLQAWARLGVWRGVLDAATAAACDAAALALALLATALLWRRVAPGRRAAFVGVSVSLAVVLFGVADTPGVIGLLAVLAIAHNFTPIGLVPADARLGAWPARSVLMALFLAPVVLFGALWAAGWGGPPVAGHRPGELGWVQAAASPQLVGALLPALVWAQCLHYLAVIHLLPRTLGSAWQGLPLRPLVLGASGMLLAFFVVDFDEARGLYAVVAGLHAWLEWPLVLLALMGGGARVAGSAGVSPAAPACPPPAQ
jgi:hypothetical protein